MFESTNIRAGTILLLSSIYLSSINKNEKDSKLLPGAFLIASIWLFALECKREKVRIRNQLEVQIQLENNAQINNVNKNSKAKAVRNLWLDRVSKLCEYYENKEVSTLSQPCENALKKHYLKQIMNQSESFLKIKEALESECVISYESVDLKNFASFRNKFVLIEFNNLIKVPSTGNFFNSLNNTNYFVFNLFELKNHLENFPTAELPQKVLLSNCKDIFVIDDDFKTIFESSGPNSEAPHTELKKSII